MVSCRYFHIYRPQPGPYSGCFHPAARPLSPDLKHVKQYRTGRFAWPVILFVLIILAGGTALCQEPALEGPAAETILKRLEKRYDCVGFTARFTQTSTLKAMDITDTASGRAFFKRPGKMRWEYEEPTPQQIITDGEHLWIYKPEESQVIVGKAPALFGNGGGVDLLTQIKKIPEQFQVVRVPEPDSPEAYQLRLIPRQETDDDVAALYLTIRRDSFDLVEIQTVNPYGDTTTIAFHQIEFADQMDDKLFSFEIPLAADVITLDNQQ